LRLPRCRELHRVGDADELESASNRPDGELSDYTTMWVIRVGGYPSGSRELSQQQLAQLFDDQDRGCDKDADRPPLRGEIGGLE
jgi:hypothetical protein